MTWITIACFATATSHKSLVHDIRKATCANSGLERPGGSTLVFVDGMKTIAQVEAVSRGVSGPKAISIVDGNEAVALSTAELGAMGFSVALYAVTALFAAAQAMRDALGALKRECTPRAVAGRTMSYAEFSELVELPHSAARLRLWLIGFCTLRQKDGTDWAIMTLYQYWASSPSVRRRSLAQYAEFTAASSANSNAQTRALRMSENVKTFSACPAVVTSGN